jgi:hypothetical protein
MTDKPVVSIFFVSQTIETGEKLTRDALRLALEQWTLGKENTHFWQVRGGFMVKCPQKYTGEKIDLKH